MSIRLSLFALFSFVLTACASNPLEVTISRCPAVAIVGDTGIVTRFDGNGRNVENVLYTATISGGSLSCEESDDVFSTVNFAITAQTDGRMNGESITLPYFVAILKDNSEIVTKRIFDVQLTFDEDGYADSFETVHQLIPTIDQARRYNYEMLIGFQLSVDDVAFNMER